MGDPDLYSDETIRLTAENIIVKSAPFEAILTNKRIILVDSRKKHIPQQTILLATLRHAELSENAIRDPVITLSILTNTGATRQMVLTFSKKSGGERKRECEDWIKILREYPSSLTQTITHRVAPAPEPEPRPEPEAITPPQIRMASGTAVKKKIEISRPIKKIIETGPVPPKPIEISTLPEGVFCVRCGNRIPTGSAFCNRCGTKVGGAGEMGAEPIPAVPVVTAPVRQTVPVMPGTPQAPPVAEFTVTVPDGTSQETPPEITPIPVSPQPVPPVVQERAVRPVEQIIHSIEPLIEDSVPRTEPAPLIIKEPVLHFPVLPTPPEATAIPVPAPEPEPVVVAPAKPAESPVEPVTPVEETPQPTPDVEPAAPVEPVTPAEPAPPVPPEPPVPGSPPAAKSRRGVMIAGIIIVLLVIAAGAFIFLKPAPAASGVPDSTVTMTPVVTHTAVTLKPSTPTPTGTITVVPTITPAVTSGTVSAGDANIPPNNVYIRITYSQTYTGTYGPPGQQVTDTGDHFYQVSTVDGPVTASVTKQDGSGEKLTVRVYKNGVLMQEESTTRPRGTVDFLAVFKTPTPTPLPTTITTTVATTPVVNATATVNTTQGVVTD
ncbi:MAG: hypothetical protein STSR0009_29310 [Methanoregula sp.]